jgi:phage terminase small subunit
LTIKERNFCEKYVECGNATEAAEVTGYSKGASARKAAYRLNKRQEIRDYIESVRQSLRPHSWQPHEIVERLQTIADKKDGKDSDKCKALELLGKAHAMFTDRVKMDLPRRVIIKNPDGNVIDNLSTPASQDVPGPNPSKALC